MVFNSSIFLLFLAVVLGLYYRLGLRGQNRLLLVASYFFYGWWDYRFLSLLLLTSTVDHWVARRIDQSPTEGGRRRWLLVSLISNLGVLGVFKYLGFFADSARQLLGLLGMEANFVTLHIVLPVGISFYTFQSISYVMDVYRKELTPARTLADFLLFVSFFPQLVAGPIERATHLLPQVTQPRRLQANVVMNGVWLILLGYVKKVVIADRLADVADWGFNHGAAPFEDARSWVVLYAFAMQIYGDFSGYSDIARGLCNLMGFDLMRNFQAPYFVTNPAAFWRHWHISLSTWLRDYLYIPLGGNRLGAAKTYRNLVLTMFLGGLWHGAGVAFVLWGLYQGLLLVIHRAWTQWRPPPAPPDLAGDMTRGGFSGYMALKVLGYFHLTCLGWLIFRAGALPGQGKQVQILKSYLAALFTPPTLAWHALFWPVLLLGGLTMLIQWKHLDMERFSEWSFNRQVTATVAALVLIISLGVLSGAQFIYFQF